MTLRKGRIYRFGYSGYKKDPRPLALVLWSDGRIAHAFNFNYLGKAVAAEVVDMVVAVAVGALDAGDSYRFYHEHIKRRLPRAIKSAYRTYKVANMRQLKEVSRGWDESKSVLERLKRVQAKAPVKAKAVAKKVAAAIKKEGSWLYDDSLSPAEMAARVDAYMSRIKDITSGEPDWDLYTGLRRKK